MPKDKRKATVMLLLLTTIFLVLVLAGIICWLILNQSRINQHQIERAKAYYTAMGGMTLAIEKLRAGDWISGALPQTYRICRYTSDENGTDSINDCRSKPECSPNPPWNNTCEYGIPYNITVSVVNSVDYTGLAVVNATVDYTFTP